ncbi:MAG: hypothetical protein K6A14_01590 [Erysipelotrichaceae bacterium]|nr:hypothetical protein [Erysipelotrichaceae bacterium]
MKQNLGKVTPVDTNMVKDERGRIILMDFKGHRGYLIEKEDEKKLGLYTSRYLLAVMVGVFVGFYGKWVFAIPLALALGGLMEYFYRSRFLPSLATIESSNLPEKRIPRYIIMANKSRKSILILLVCSIALAFLLILNCNLTVKQNGKGITHVDNLLLIVVSAGLSIYSCVQAVSAVRALDYLKKGGN